MAKKCCILLPWTQMQVPSKVSFTMVVCQASVLSVLFFQSSEVSFQRIRGFGNEGIIKVAEHVRQGGEQHTAGSLEIAKYPTLLG